MTSQIVAMPYSKFTWRLLVLGLLGFLLASIAISQRPLEDSIRIHNGNEFEAEGFPNITAVHKKLLGTWHLESYELKLHVPVTITQYPLSSKAIGLLTYTPDGYMSAQLMQPGSKSFDKFAYHLGSDKEFAEAAKHYLAYAGTYSLGLTKDHIPYVNHSLETSLFPNWLGSNQTRLLKLDSDRLTLVPDELPRFMGIQVEAILKWKKARREI